MRVRRLLTVLAFTLMLIFTCAFSSYASTSSKLTRVKNYKIYHCWLKYNSSTGQVIASWTTPKKATEKVVTLYRDGVPIEEQVVVPESNQTYDFTETVIGKDGGTGKYYIEVYPQEIGDGYTRTSSKLTINEKKLAKANEFDSNLYQFTGSEWSFDKTTNRVKAKWWKGDKDSAAKVMLYKGDTAASDWIAVSGRNYEFTSLIAQKGSGTYKFKVYPTVIGDSYMEESVELYIDTDTHKKIKAVADADAKAEEAARLGWYKVDGSTAWKYYKTPGQMAKKEWLTIDGKTYYFSSSGIMQIGWQAIDDKWYYFGNNGVLARNITTMGGRKVNGNGEWVDDNGVPVSAKGQKQAPSEPVTLSKCTIGVSENGKEAGVVKTATFNAGTGFTISDVKYSVPQENWKAGEGVRVTIKVKANANYYFENGVKFTVRNCNPVNSYGDEFERTVTFTYYPRMQLMTPSFFYVQNNDNTFRWKPIDGAKNYKVIVYDDKTQVLNTTTENPEINMDDMFVEKPAMLTMKITANASKGNSKFLLTSAAAEIKDVEKLLDECTIDGTLTWSKNSGRPKYLTATGEKAQGWVKLAGRWMHFGKSGYGDGPGWFKDTDGLWYYFDQDYTMCTGLINDGRATYFLNDGSNPNLPLGAYKE